jgi:hypothetical protein
MSRRQAVDGATFHPSIVRRQRSTTVIIAGVSGVSGSASLRRWRPRAPFPTSFLSTAERQSSSLGERLKKGGLKKRSVAPGAEGRARSMLWPMIAADRSLRADARKRRQRRYGRSPSRRRRKTKSACSQTHAYSLDRAVVQQPYSGEQSR